jgi:hypothetical protein
MFVFERRGAHGETPLQNFDTASLTPGLEKNLTRNQVTTLIKLPKNAIEKVHAPGYRDSHGII